MSSTASFTSLFADDIKSLNKTHQDHLKNLTLISEYIKDFETQMSLECVHIEHSYEIDRQRSENLEDKITYLTWALCEKSNKWRIFLKHVETDFDQLRERKKPLIEYDANTRAFGASHLKPFLKNFVDKVNGDFWESTEALGIIKGEI